MVRKTNTQYGWLNGSGLLDGEVGYLPAAILHLPEERTLLTPRHGIKPYKAMRRKKVIVLSHNNTDLIKKNV